MRTIYSTYLKYIFWFKFGVGYNFKRSLLVMYTICFEFKSALNWNKSLLFEKSLLIAFLIVLLLNSSDTFAKNECLTLEKCLHIAIYNRQEIKSVENDYNAAALRVKSLKKGTGYRSDIAFSFHRNDLHMRRSEANILTDLEENRYKSTLNMSQKYIWGGSIDAFIDLYQANQDEHPFRELEDSVVIGSRIRHELLTTTELKLNLEAQKIRSKETAAKKNLTLREVIFSTSSSYYSYIRAKHIFKIYSESFEMTEALCNYANAKFINGITTDIDLLEAKTELSILKASLEKAKIELSIARNDLLKNLNMNINEVNICSACEQRPYKFSNTGIASIQARKIPKLDPIIVTNDLIDNHPELIILQKKIQMLELEKKREQKNFQTSLALEGNYMRQIYGPNSLDFSNKEYTNEWSLGFTLNVPLWDNGINRDKMKSIDCLIASMKHQKKTQYLSFKSEIENALHSIKSLHEVIEISKLAVTIAETNIDLKNKKFSEGLINIDDVLRARQNLTKAKLSNVDNIIDYNISIVNLEYLVGNEPFL